MKLQVQAVGDGAPALRLRNFTTVDFILWLAVIFTLNYQFYDKNAFEFFLYHYAHAYCA